MDISNAIPQPEETQLPAEGGIEPTPQESIDPVPEGGVPAADASPQPAPDITPAEPEITDDLDVEPEPDSKTITIPTSAMKQIKSAEREKGRREAATQFENQLSAVARMFGFTTFDEMNEADPEKFWESKQQSQSRSDRSRSETPEPEAPVEENAMSTPAEELDDSKDRPRYTKRLERENARLLDEKKRLNRKTAHEERRRRGLERQMEAKDAETDLRIAAARAGVVDVDYALHVMKKTLRGKTAEELQDFSEDKFFGEELRQKHPHLYETETQAATTGVGGEQQGDAGGAPPAGQGAGAKPAEANGDGSVDARKMSREDYQAMLKKRGLTDPAVGMPTG